ncbi:MAG TPA: hypothetical protein ENK27_05170 [Desulfobulbus sp.]|nr:hypothetical protein [Desulfobulbus sp.]
MLFPGLLAGEKEKKKAAITGLQPLLILGGGEKGACIRFCSAFLVQVAETEKRASNIVDLTTL